MSEGSPAIYLLPAALLVGGVLCFSAKPHHSPTYVDPATSGPTSAEFGYPFTEVAEATEPRTLSPLPLPLPMSRWDSPRQMAADEEMLIAAPPGLTAEVSPPLASEYDAEYDAEYDSTTLPFTSPMAAQPTSAAARALPVHHEEHLHHHTSTGEVVSVPGPIASRPPPFTQARPTVNSATVNPATSDAFGQDGGVWSAIPAFPPPFDVPVETRSVVRSNTLANQASGADQVRRRNLRARTLEQARRLIEQGALLAEKQAVFAAKSNFERSLNMIAQALDTIDRGVRRDRLDASMTAFKEAGDLYAYSQSRRPPQLSHVVLVHDTPVLKQIADLDRLSYPEALQMYFTFAQQQLVDALGESRQASSALYSLGKLHKGMASQPSPRDNLHGPKAMAFHQAALMIDPDHHLAANELAVLLAGYGEYEPAKQILIQSLSAQPTVAGWHNLAHVHERLQEFDLARLADYERQAAEQDRQRQPAPFASRDEHGYVRWVDTEEFAQTAGPAAVQTANAGAARPRPAGPPPPARNVSTSSSWWGPRKP
ncbi:MAG: tetratricopeptide repeat protein [Pirellulaceae bacterium]|nr:tetratricopeptide repeat protein [Pirellulaceae bacterium]